MRTEPRQQPTETQVSPYNDPDDPLVQLGRAEAEAEAAAAENTPAAGEPAPAEGEVPAPAEGEVPPAADTLLAGRFKTPEELERGYNELNQTIGRQGSELGQQIAQLRADNEALQRQVQGVPQQAQVGDGAELPQLSMEQLQAWYDENPVEATLYMASLAGTAAVQPYAEQFEQQIKPLRDSSAAAQSNVVIEGLKKSVGEDAFSRNRDVIASAIAADQAAGITYTSEKAAFQRLRSVVITAEYDRGVLQAPGQGQPAPETGETPAGAVVTRRAVAATAGGSTPQPAGNEPEIDPILAEMDRAVETRGIFGRQRRPDLFMQQ